jgi:hypothetical protein
MARESVTPTKEAISKENQLNQSQDQTNGNFLYILMIYIDEIF